MIAQVYEFTGDVSRSILGARLLTEVEIDEMPTDQDGFAAEYGGDFIEVLKDAFA
jgi:hypothetical protein